MHPIRNVRNRHADASLGFTLLEVMVALVIVGTALGASLRAIGSLTQNSGGLRATTLAGMSAENSLVNIRLSKTWPDLGQHMIDCPQEEFQLVCELNVSPSRNVNFRRVEVNVYDVREPQHRLGHLVQVVSNGL